MRVLITGATGLIGKEVGKRLSAKGVELNIVSRNPGRAKLELPFPAKVFEWQGGSHDFPEAALTGVDGVIHLAGESVAESRWTEEKKKSIRDSRVLGTLSLVNAIEAMKSPKPKTFVLGSAIGIYGDRGDELLTEESAAGQGFLADVVREWEGAAAPLENKAVHPEMRVVHLRTAVVFSRREGAFAKLAPIFGKGLGGKLGNGNQWMSWIHISDIARAFVFALENPAASGIVNGCAPEPTRNDRFTVAMARAIGRPVFLPVPETALKAMLGEASSAILGSQRVLPKRLEELGFQFEHGALVAALEELAEPLRGNQHELVAEQWIPVPPKDIFPFFSDEKNLEQLTPPFLNFKVLSKSTPEVCAGTLIDYRLSLHGIPLKWRTKIETWTSGKSFSDVQLSGPYSKWHHTHDFLPVAGGTLLRDRVLYKLPMGFFGDTVAGWRVTRDVQKIFAYRRKVIEERFGAPQ
jgi:uncharacterized protein (TIGR01777 family)